MNLGEFKSLLDRYLKRNDLRDLYDDWFLFTSLRIDQQLRLAVQEFRTITTPTEQYIPLPLDFIEMRSLESKGANGGPIRYATGRSIDVASMAVRSGPPRFYSILDTQLELIPAPQADSVAELEMVYYAKQPIITADAATNKVLTTFPNLYLYGCMMEAAVFRMDATDNKNYTQMWRDYATELNNRQQAGRFSGGPLEMRMPI
jgi:hypothetical protein